MKRVPAVIAILIMCPTLAVAQDGLLEVTRAPRAVTANVAPIDAAEESAELGVVHGFARDVAHDYRNIFSGENAAWLGVGGLTSLAVHPLDEPIQRRVLEAGEPLLSGGELWGSQKLQVPLAIAWWVVGSAAGRDRDAAAGRNLLRAQISVFSWTYAIKYAVGRTRPNGDPNSFPSGHASTSFATAMVLQEHYGWKVGVPAFAAATYTIASRVTANQHWLSDVMFGAALGMMSGRTVTLQVRETRVTVTPLVVPGGGGISFRQTR